MKSGSDNFKASAIREIISRVNADIVIYEPTLSSETYNGCKVINDIDEFISKSDVIIANRLDDCLMEVSEKVYSRDAFNKD